MAVRLVVNAAVRTTTSFVYLVYLPRSSIIAHDLESCCQTPWLPLLGAPWLPLLGPRPLSPVHAMPWRH